MVEADGAAGLEVVDPELADLPANATNYSDASLTASTTYAYRVRAYNVSGNSPYSNEVSASTLPDPPSAPSGLTATAVAHDRIDLAWMDTSSNSETGFKVERRAGGSYAQIADLGPNVTTYSDRGLTTNTTYTYRARAYNAGGHSPYSNEGQARTPTDNLRLSLQVSSVRGGQQVRGTVTLLGPASNSNRTVSLTSSHPAIARVPATLTIRRGRSSAGLVVLSFRTPSASTVTISASYAGETKSAPLTITPRR